MKTTARKRQTSAVSDQFAGVIVDTVNTARIAEEAAQLVNQDQSFQKSLEEMAKVREFVNAPEHILGSLDTKHGEVAEHVEVGLRRAREVLAGTEPTATFEGIDRFAPEDYRIGGIDVQSKFINGTPKGLDHVLKHMGQYDDFGRDGSFYHIPKDQYAQIQAVLRGETEGMSAKTVAAIERKIASIEELSGKNFEDVVKPSVSEYSEVQLGKVHDTLDGHNEDLQKQNESLKDQIRTEHQPSLSEGLKATGIAAAVGAAVGFTAKTWQKYREGKNIFKGEFTAKDWKEVGGASFKGAVGGALAGGAIYVLTNCAEMSAPFAGAVVSAAKGVTSLVADYKARRISREALLDEGLFVCGEAAIVGLCTAASQTLIPIPVLGAVLGSVAGKLLASFLGKKIRGTQRALDEKLEEFRAALSAKYQKVMAELEARIAELGELTRAAFDPALNEQLVQTSIALARAHGVPEHRILKSVEDLDAYMS